jgi:predicted DNA binding CopG/RHH family protein
VFPDPEHSNREERFKAIGRTEAGRAMLIVFTLRVRGGETLIRPISARYIAAERSTIMKKKLPRLQTDEEAEEFVANSDLTEYDLSEFRTVLFEFQPKSERVNMRLPKTLLDAVKASAAKAGIPYQRFIRQVLEAAVKSSAGSRQID